MSERALPVGGSVLGPKTMVLFLLAVVGLALVVWRFAVGLGPSTALSDGYPWGLWIAFDVVTGTALACGGYAMALIVYILNKGRYHPLIRPAILTSALGYSLAGLAIVIDVGRPWLIWRIPLSPFEWNLDSALLEVALCVMAYVVVLWIELSPAFLEKWADGGGALAGFARKVTPILDKSLIWIIALGLLLPTMHQSSLGSVILLAGPRLHGLWHSAWIPLLFLISCVGMGYAAVVLEASLSSRAFGRKREDKMLAALSPVIAVSLFLFVGLRLVDVLVAGKASLIFGEGHYSWLFLLELALFLVPAIVLTLKGKSAKIGTMFRCALMIVFGGALYRFDAYLVAFNPGEQWSYFPSVTETVITLGLVAGEILIYIFLVKRFPILGGAARAPQS